MPRRFLSLFGSLVVHAGVFGLLLGAAALPDVGSGAGEADLGGEADGPAELVAEGTDLDFGPATVKLVSIGIVTDEPVPANVVQAAEVASPVAPVTPVAPKPPEPLPPTPEAPQVVDTPQPEAEAQATAAVASADDDAEVADAPTEPEAVPEVAPNPHKQGKGMVRGAGRKPTGKGKKHEACVVNPDDGIAEVAPLSWQVERDVVEYYAGHIKALMKLGSVRANKEADGKLRGFRVGLSKCSLLREGGLRTGDIVRDVNGVEVHDVIGAIGAYLRLRREEHFEVRVTRRGQEMVLRYELI